MTKINASDAKQPTAQPVQAAAPAADQPAPTTASTASRKPAPDRVGLPGLARASGLSLGGTSGAARVAAAKAIVASGYTYTNPYTDAHHGVCADFVTSALDRAAGQPNGTLEKRMNDYLKPKGPNDPRNARNVNGQLAYWKAHPSEATVTDVRGHDPKTGMQPGDLIYFYKPGTHTLHHVAMVTAVDANGTPTELAHAHGLTNDSSNATDQGTPATVNGLDFKSGRYNEFHHLSDVAFVVRPK